MSPRFFLSYARRDIDVKFKRFFDDLQGALRVRGGVDPDEVLFRDMTSVDWGDDWEAGIKHALQHAEVLVCLLSPSFFKSEWCGKEVAVFDQRWQAAPEPRGRAILPVRWTPPRREIPKVVNRFSWNPDLPEAYERDGLWRMVLDGRYHSEYEAIRIALADAMLAAASAADRLAPLAAPPDFDAIASAFHGAAATSPTAAPITRPSHHETDLYLLCLAVTEDHVSALQRTDGHAAYRDRPEKWDPFSSRSVMRSASRVAEELGMACYALDPHSPSLPLQLEKAFQRNTPVLVVIDPWSLDHAPLDDVAREVESTRPLPNMCGLAALAPDAETAARHATLVDAVVDRFPNKYLVGQVRVPAAALQSAEDLERQMKEGVDDALDRMLRFGVVKRRAGALPSALPRVSGQPGSAA